MKVQVSESGSWRRTLEVEVPGADVEKRLETAYRSYGKTLKIPGFRQGKVPVKLVKARFGEAIREEVVQELMQEYYREASDAEDLHPISQATIEEVDYDEGQPLKFKASVDIKPEIEVEGYKALQVSRPIFKVEDAHIDEQVALLQNQNATEEAVERPACRPPGSRRVGRADRWQASGGPPPSDRGAQHAQPRPRQPAGGDLRRREPPRATDTLRRR